MIGRCEYIKTFPMILVITSNAGDHHDVLMRTFLDSDTNNSGVVPSSALHVRWKSHPMLISMSDKYKKRSMKCNQKTSPYVRKWGLLLQRSSGHRMRPNFALSATGQITELSTFLQELESYQPLVIAIWK